MAEVAMHPLHHADHVVRAEDGLIPRDGLYRMQLLDPRTNRSYVAVIMKFNCRHSFDTSSASLVDN